MGHAAYGDDHIHVGEDMDDGDHQAHAPYDHYDGDPDGLHRPMWHEEQGDFLVTHK